MKPPAFQFYPDDFVAGVAILSTEEVGAYTLLLCHQWSAGGVPDNDTLIRRIAKVGPDFNIDLIRQKFEVGTDGLLRNSRMETERDKQVAYRESRSANGKLGGRPAKPHENHMVSQPKAQPKAKKSSPSPSPSPSPVSVYNSDTDSNTDALRAGNGHFAAFVDGWSKNFESTHGFAYRFDGGKDGRAVKDLLAFGVSTIDLLDIASKAWRKMSEDRFCRACKQASTIHGFRHALNDIRIELGHKPKPESKQLQETIEVKSLL